MNRTPTPTECTLRIVHVHQHLPTCTHCDAWLHLYNSVRITVYNQCLSSYVHCDAWLHLYNSVWTGTMNRPLRLWNVRCGLFTYTNIYPRAPIVMRDCIYTIRCERARWIGPYAYGMCAADCSRTPTVGADLSCPHITECMLQLFMRNQCLFHEYMIFVHVHPLRYVVVFT